MQFRHRHTGEALEFYVSVDQGLSGAKFGNSDREGNMIQELPEPVIIERFRQMRKVGNGWWSRIEIFRIGHERPPVCWWTSYHGAEKST